MSLITRLNNFFNKNASDFIEKQSVISSKRISQISFWEVYNEANEQFNKNKSDQQTTLMSKSEKVLELSDEKKLNGDHESILFYAKIVKITRNSLLTLFNFNERKYKNGVRNSSDEFIYEDFKNLKFFL
ncbi:hypothetical protein [Rickettsiella endosymbiont of Xylota segnis]|uniref:hypothetical protein n=1 Tax=Rickettsiella endosymbiont of Xylota segnis TaxID=3066238 RepID=UPI0030D1E561